MPHHRTRAKHATDGQTPPSHSLPLPCSLSQKLKPQAWRVRWRQLFSPLCPMLTYPQRPRQGCLQLVLDGLGLLGCVSCLPRCRRRRLDGAGGLLALVDEVDDVIRRPATVVGGDLPAGSHEVHGWVALDLELTGHVIGGRVLETGVGLSHNGGFFVRGVR